ncbi:hypothetical protein FACS1894187_24810 [Synergistales bacterium]|nr:hypothetical protein FACS1894187_24810 [Synergistales bacterium]
MKVAEVIVKIFEREGIDTVYGIPGAGINGVYKYLGQSSILKHFCHRHEEACVHAAGGHFRASGKLTVAMCASGPGATNFVTGIYTCNIDSIPVIAVTGQAVTAQLGKDAFQCVDIAKICAPVAKKTWCVTDPKKVVETFAEAFRVDREGKPGLVVIDLPFDVRNADIEFDSTNYVPLTFDAPAPKTTDVVMAIEMIGAAKNPILLMGGGVLLAINHPLNAGHCGIQVGQPIGNRAFLDSDLVLGIGCRFTERGDDGGFWLHVPHSGVGRLRH